VHQAIYWGLGGLWYPGPWRFLYFGDPRTMYWNNYPYVPIQWCGPDPHTSGVLKANVITYKDAWDYPLAYGISDSLNNYESGRRGKWRPFETYVFNDTTIQGSNPSLGQRNYNGAGVSYRFPKDAWLNIPSIYPNLWVKTDSITSYSPNGHATESWNGNKIPSTAKLGYYGMYPYLTAQNAAYNSVAFESFEISYPDSLNIKFEDGLKGFNNFSSDAHTGHRSYKLMADTSHRLSFKKMWDVSGRGFVARVWARIGNATDSANFVSQVRFKVGTHDSASFHYVGRSGIGSGYWCLFEAVCRPPSPMPNTIKDCDIVYSNNESFFWVDDVKIQPLESKTTAYVYDTWTSRLLAIIDDNHFSTLYQYNGEGKLIRKIKETIHGTQQVEEAQYHTQQRTKLSDIGTY